ncbi:MAG: peptide chain release factor 2 [bacterium]|nr:peptide chain release factor 2 [bacterium]
MRIYGGIFELPQKHQKILELEDEMSSPNFWTDRLAANKKTKELKNLKTQVESWDQMEKDIVELKELVELAATGGEVELQKDMESKFQEIRKNYEKIHITTFFSGKYDDHAAIVSIHSGAGGLDAQDWAEMLMRMYLRFCENKKFKVQMLDQNRSPEAGIKSVTFEVHGEYAYGFLKSEAGVHRLIRLSPFNPAHTRETSFALVEVLPLLEESEESELDQKDLRIEAKTAGGHGGQSVNTTYSAIRITHIPTGITVSIQNERSQTQNKKQALKILKAKLEKLEEEKQLQDRLKLRGEFKSAEWGNQIRSYTIHPYKLVKDHRTAFETSDTDSVLDGNLEEFIEKFLEK